MPSSDRVDLMNPQESVSTNDWHRVPHPAYGVVPSRQPIANGSPETAVDQSVPSGSGETGRTLEQADTSIDGEEKTLWEGQPSIKIFVPRFLLGGLLSMAWIVLALATWSFGYSGLAFFAWAGAAVLAIFWVLTGLKLFRTTKSHHYRLTPRRLIVRTGLLRRRLDQIEMLRVKDVFVHQSLLDTWLGTGHVVVLSSEVTLPRATLYGIEQPRSVMDSIWLQTRAELDRKTTRIEKV